jgi:hypothetical protein
MLVGRTLYTGPRPLCKNFMHFWVKPAAGNNPQFAEPIQLDVPPMDLDTRM